MNSDCRRTIGVIQSAPGPVLDGAKYDRELLEDRSVREHRTKTKVEPNHDPLEGVPSGARRLMTGRITA